MRRIATIIRDLVEIEESLRIVEKARQETLKELREHNGIGPYSDRARAYCDGRPFKVTRGRTGVCHVKVGAE